MSRFGPTVLEAGTWEMLFIIALSVIGLVGFIAYRLGRRR